MTNEIQAIENQQTRLARQGQGFQDSAPTAIGNPASVEELKGQVEVIQRAMSSVMKQGEHYGTIPGTTKPTLMKPGAEKLNLLFRLSPEYKIDRTDMGGGHREYEVICTLKHINSGNIVGQGVGSCNSRESKYLYRSENTGELVPKEYWNNKDKSILGGDQYSPRKVAGSWYIFHKEEHDNPADNYNTILKMAKKRAHVDAILTATAASDIFTQDLEDIKTPSNPAPPQDQQSQHSQGSEPPQPKQQSTAENKSSNAKPWLNRTPKGSSEITDEWNDVCWKLGSGEWSMGDVLDRYKLSKDNKAKLEETTQGGGGDDLPF